MLGLPRQPFISTVSCLHLLAGLSPAAKFSAQLQSNCWMELVTELSQGLLFMMSQGSEHLDCHLYQARPNNEIVDLYKYLYLKLRQDHEEYPQTFLKSCHFLL